MAGRNSHMSSTSINSEEMSLLNSREHTSVPDLAFSDLSYFHMVITFSKKIAEKNANCTPSSAGKGR